MSNQENFSVECRTHNRWRHISVYASILLSQFLLQHWVFLLRWLERNPAQREEQHEFRRAGEVPSVLSALGAPCAKQSSQVSDHTKIASYRRTPSVATAGAGREKEWGGERERGGKGDLMQSTQQNSGSLGRKKPKELSS